LDGRKPVKAVKPVTATSIWRSAASPIALDL